jgi:hypothetical protein
MWKNGVKTGILLEIRIVAPHAAVIIMIVKKISNALPVEGTVSRNAQTPWVFVFACFKNRQK